MELRDYVSAVRKRWWLVATTACLALVGAVVLTAKTAPTYAANVTFFVSTPSSSLPWSSVTPPAKSRRSARSWQPSPSAHSSRPPPTTA